MKIVVPEQKAHVEFFCDMCGIKECERSNNGSPTLWNRLRFARRGMDGVAYGEISLDLCEICSLRVHAWLQETQKKEKAEKISLSVPAETKGKG